MSNPVLEQKLAALASFPNLQTESVQRFGDALRSLDDWQLLRLNPIAFAAENGFEAAESIDLFVHATKVGLFDFSWNQICPSCGALVVRHGSVNALTPLAHCALCDVDVEGHLDDQVEVAFALHPSAGRKEIDPYSSGEAYWRYFFSPNYRRSEKLEALVRSAILGLALPAPDASSVFELDAEAGQTYGLVSVERNVSAWLEPVSEGAGASELSFDLLDTGMFPATAAIAPGPAIIRVRNRMKAHAGVILVRDEEKIAALIAEDPPRMHPFLTGKALLNNQSFRDLFRIHQLDPDLQLPLRSLTLLFTDLKGSTALYDRTGDAYAYSLVRQHYDELADAVRQASGAVIKTMGDAIMASFSNPLDAVRAAIDMVERIDNLNRTWIANGDELGLKVGLHEGPALAVNADDRLDFFGQTVNIAARVQALAEAGEIWHTDCVLETAGVDRVLREHGFSPEAHSVSLKGVGAPVRVHQWKVADR